MSVNGFDNEESVAAAYDAAEWWLHRAVDSRWISIVEEKESGSGVGSGGLLRMLAVRIAEAVMHSSEADIADLIPDVVEKVRSPHL
jgi:hypothetical protein